MFQLRFSTLKLAQAPAVLTNESPTFKRTVALCVVSNVTHPPVPAPVEFADPAATAAFFQVPYDANGRSNCATK